MYYSIYVGWGEFSYKGEISDIGDGWYIYRMKVNKKAMVLEYYCLFFPEKPHLLPHG